MSGDTPIIGATPIVAATAIDAFHFRFISYSSYD